MSHRVNFKVYRLGKTVKWNFSSPLTNIQHSLRLNYIMSHWVKRALIDQNIKVFKFFYSIAPDFPFIKVIGYRKLYIKSKKFFSNYTFTLKSSQLLDSDNLSAFSQGRPSARLVFYRQREKNRKLITVKETPKQRKASYKTVLLPLLSANSSSAFLFNFFLMEKKSSVAINSFSTGYNYVFDHNFLFNTLAIFSLVGSAGNYSYKQFNYDSPFKSLIKPVSYIATIFKNIKKTESSGWLKFFVFYAHLFLTTHKLSENRASAFQSISEEDIYYFFLLKKAFFVLKLVLKSYPQNIFLNAVETGAEFRARKDIKIFSSSSFLLNILRFYFFVVDNKEFDTRFFVYSGLARKIRNRPSYYVFLKLKMIIIFFKHIKNFNKHLIIILNFFNNIAFNNIRSVKNKIIFSWRGILTEVFNFWAKGLSLNQTRGKLALTLINSAGHLAAQTVVFLNNGTNIKYPPTANFFAHMSGWWRSRFFLNTTFDYEYLFYLILGYSRSRNFAVNEVFSNFNTYFSSNFINDYFRKWSSVFLNNIYNSALFDISNSEFGNKKRRRKYVRPVKLFADIDKALSTRIPETYSNLLKTSLKSSSVFSFFKYEHKLKMDYHTALQTNRPDVHLKKLVNNLLFLLKKIDNEKVYSSVVTKSGAGVEQVVKIVTFKFFNSLKNLFLSRLNNNFFYASRIIKFFENALTFWRAFQRDINLKHSFFKKSVFKTTIFSAFKINCGINLFCFTNKYRYILNHLFLNPVQYSFLGKENVDTIKNYLNKNTLVYFQEKVSNSLVFVNSNFSYVNPTISPLGAVKANKNVTIYLKKLLLQPFSPVLFNFGFLSVNFLNDKFSILSDKLNRNFFACFKSNYFFNSFKKTKNSLSFVIFCSMVYSVNNFGFNRNFFSTMSFQPGFNNANVFFKKGKKEFSRNKLKLSNLIENNRPYLNLVSSLNEFFLESTFLLNLTSAFFKVFGISYEVVFYPIYRVFQDNSRFQFLISQAGDFLRAYVSRNPYVLYWLNEFIVLFYASIATRSTKALSQFMAERFKKEYYWNQPAAFMFSVIRSIWMHEFGILGMRIGFHGKFGGQERAYRLYKNWGANPCLRNGLLTGSHSSSRCHSKYGITDIHIWLVYY